jgi:hypothetical protein
VKPFILLFSVLLFFGCTKQKDEVFDLCLSRAKNIYSGENEEKKTVLDIKYYVIECMHENDFYLAENCDAFSETQALSPICYIKR